MRLYEFKHQPVIKNPFPASVFQDVVYHGTNAKFDRFERRPEGIYITKYWGYAEDHYGEAMPIHVDIRNLYDPPDGGYTDELDAVFDRDYDQVAVWLDKLKSQGYDSVRMFGDGDSTILFGDNVRIVHAVTGKEM